MINVLEKTTTARPPSAGLLRRVGSIVYESLLLAAVLFVASFFFISLVQTPPHGFGRGVFQIYLIIVTATYLLWFWTHGGQTLAMKTWHIRLINSHGGNINYAAALLRFLLALLGTGAFGIGFLWALVDHERQFLHDRLVGSRLVDARTAQLFINQN